MRFLITNTAFELENTCFKLEDCNCQPNKIRFFGRAKNYIKLLFQANLFRNFATTKKNVWHFIDVQSLTFDIATFWQCTNSGLRSVGKCVLCRSRRELWKEAFSVKFGVDAAENEPSKVWPACPGPACPRDQPPASVCFLKKLSGLGILTTSYLAKNDHQ